MKKSIKTILAGLLIAPALALGISLSTPLSQTVSAVSGIQEGASAAKADGTSDSLFGDSGIFKVITNAALYIIVLLLWGGVILSRRCSKEHLLLVQ